MRILYITQWFDPEPTLKGAAFAQALANAGHKVEVATGFPNYPGGKLYPGYRLRPHQVETMKGVRVHRMWLYPSHDTSSINRIFNYVSFFLSILLFGLWRGPRYDLVYVYHPPLTPALAAALFCKFHRKPFIVEIQDLWPDSVRASGMANPRVVRTLEQMCRFVYQRATRIIAQSDSMKSELMQRGVPAERLSTVFNWATYEESLERKQQIPASILTSFTGKLNFVYGGNIGQAQQLDVLIKATMIAQRNNPTVRLHLVGDGIMREELQQRARAMGAEEAVHFHAPVARDVMDRIFDAADVLAMHLKQDALYEITIPSKTQHYLACAKPIVAGLQGEAAEILERSGGAFVCPPSDVDALAHQMERMADMTPEQRKEMGMRSRAYYEQNFSMNRAIEKTAQLIQTAC